jgi:hypothetical protein
MTGRYTPVLVIAGFIGLSSIIIWATLFHESKISQCSRFAAVVDDTIGTNANLVRQTIAENNTLLIKNAELLETYAKQLESMKFDNLQIQDFQKRFVALYRKIGQANRNVVAASDKSLQAVRQANLKLIEAQAGESLLVRELNQSCHSS